MRPLRLSWWRLRARRLASRAALCRVLQRASLGVCLVGGGLAHAGDCRVAFDMGSSGIRAGASNSAATARADIDYLSPQWSGRGVRDTLVPTIAALNALPRQAAFASECARVGGGFSAWRFALAHEPVALVSMLAEIHTASGVAVLVIPPLQEGAYGYVAARQLLGDRLQTSHVLDIGGGSLQIAGASTSFVDTLGQKVWYRQLCELAGAPADEACHLQPMLPASLALAREALAKRLAGVRAALPEGATMTAISRPVTRGVLPALTRLDGNPAPQLSQARIRAAIDHLSALSVEASAALAGIAPEHAAYLLSDLLLLDGLLQATGGDAIQVAEIDLTNLPGLLADDRAYAWERHYACYLARLGERGLAAYASDPETCAP
ncbi:hypothetical protein GHK24_02630 [Rhodocyclus tenuis]|uniref:Ppx/GppA phosphatase N-terminal domain-containing protein n=1 Tax=Rhodocyclus tenuis TaxID=1066 RepID=A0A6L5JTF6_RHOTE|nr:hypothetical protein [Rhodocyclus gracilis]